VVPRLHPRGAIHRNPSVSGIKLKLADADVYWTLGPPSEAHAGKSRKEEEVLFLRLWVENSCIKEQGEDKEVHELESHPWGRLRQIFSVSGEGVPLVVARWAYDSSLGPIAWVDHQWTSPHNQEPACGTVEVWMKSADIFWYNIFYNLTLLLIFSFPPVKRFPMNRHSTLCCSICTNDGLWKLSTFELHWGGRSDNWLKDGIHSVKVLKVSLESGGMVLLSFGCWWTIFNGNKANIEEFTTRI